MNPRFEKFHREKFYLLRIVRQIWSVSRCVLDFVKRIIFAKLELICTIAWNIDALVMWSQTDTFYKNVVILYHSRWLMSDPLESKRLIFIESINLISVLLDQ